MSYNWVEDAILGTIGLQEASPEQSVAQDILHALINAQVVGLPSTDPTVAQIQSIASTTISRHPDVYSVDYITTTVDDETNQINVSFQVNGTIPNTLINVTGQP